MFESCHHGRRKSFFTIEVLESTFNVLTGHNNLPLTKVLMQGKLIAVAYTLRTYRNQFSLGGICKQE